jgi:acyl dehydratase
MGLYYEDFEVGREFLTGPRTVTAADIRAFADVSGDHNPIHLDPAAARAAGFDVPVAHGVFGLAAATGLANQLELTRGTLVALVGVSWKFKRPVADGDTLTVRLRVASRRGTDKPDRGLVTLAAQMTNQRKEIVQEGEFVELVRRRES